MLKIVTYHQQENVRKDVAFLFLEAFPEDERPPVSRFFANLKRKENKLLAYYQEGVFIGFSYLTFYEDVCFIFFLAISKEYRHQGYGGWILEYLKQEYQDYVLLLGYEEVDPRYPNYQERINRERFYFAHGFKNNHLKTDEYGVIFQTAFIGHHQIDFKTYLEIFKLGFGQGCEKFIKEVTSLQ